MRTTVTIDPDVEVLLERAMRETGAPFKPVLNNAVREGLRASASKSKKAGQAYRQPVFDMGVPGTRGVLAQQQAARQRLITLAPPTPPAARSGVTGAARVRVGAAGAAGVSPGGVSGVAASVEATV